MAVPFRQFPLTKQLNNQQTLESEKALVASVLSDNSQIDRVIPIVKAEMFYHGFHEVLWNKIVTLHKSGVKVDLTTLTSQLTNSDSPSGNPMYEVTGFFEYMAAPSNAVQYAKNIYEKYELRRLKVLTNELSNSIGHDNVKTVDSLTKIHGKIGNVLSVHGDNEFDLNSSLDNAIVDMYNKDNTIKFGFGPLDHIVGGMRRGEITVIAGRPGHFKSTMAVNVVHNLLEKGYKVLVFNREMKNESMLAKMIVAESKQVSYTRVVTGAYTKNDKEDIKVTKETLLKKYGDRLIMKDKSNDFESTVATIRQVKPDVVVDDYIGLATLRHVEDPRLRIDAIMKEYKLLCKSYDMCAILVSQLNRKCEDRPNKRPIPSDLRESGSIEQDSETILFMFYEWRYLGVGSKNGEYGIEIVIGKNRYGKTGRVELGVIGEKCKILDHHSVALAEKYEMEEYNGKKSIVHGKANGSNTQRNESLF